MSLSLQITTFNNPDALEMVLLSVCWQTVQPDEVLVLDDGSVQATADLVERFRGRIARLRHLWQTDCGYRLARLRNLGILHTDADYIISVDGDMLLHPRFIADHQGAAHAGYFVQGTRQRLNGILSQRLLREKRMPQGFERVFQRESKNKSRLWGIHNAWAKRVWSRRYCEPRKIMGCNQSFFRADLKEINGYENGFIGWGEEDYDLASRLALYGIREFHLRYGGIAWHLYHPQRERVNRGAVKSTVFFAENGLKELAAEPIDYVIR